MVLKQFFEPRLSQYSYLVGCPASGRAVVIDPVRKLDQYVEAADAEGLRITDVTETHIHADFASGARALAQRTGATLHVSGEGGPDWQYAFASHAGVNVVGHGAVLAAGSIELKVLHTPGHTPEHLTFVVTDRAQSPEPLGAFTGDFVFAGDVGRPDLLEKAAGQRGTADAAARRLFASIRSFAANPDHWLLWPGHGAGSACGKRLGGTPVTTLGYEKLTNWAFTTREEDAFVEAILSDQPDAPRYFGEMKRPNRLGAPRRRAKAELRRLGSAELQSLVVAHAEFIDLRSDASTSGYLPGSILLSLTRQFLTYAGSVLRYGMPVYLVSDDGHDAAEGMEALALIGIDDVKGWVPRATLDAYEAEGGGLERMVTIAVAEALERQARGHLLLDVRSTSEWRAGHMPNAVHAPLATMLDSVRDLDRDTPVSVYCQAGSRSRVAATALRRVGFTHVANVEGGYAEYAGTTKATSQTEVASVPAGVPAEAP
jgi:hydroxyacylglutathione hydrolase